MVVFCLSIHVDVRGLGNEHCASVCWLAVGLVGDLTIFSDRLMQSSESAAAYRRTLQQRVNDPLVLCFGRAAEGSDRAALGSPAQKSFLRDPKGLPPNVHLLTLKDNGDGLVLLRLAHLYQVLLLFAPLLSPPKAISATEAQQPLHVSWVRL